MNPMDLKRGIDLATAKVVAHIKAAARDVTDSDEVAQVGTISANGEKEIGRQIADAMQKVGTRRRHHRRGTRRLETGPKSSKACSSTRLPLAYSRHQNRRQDRSLSELGTDVRSCSTRRSCRRLQPVWFPCSRSVIPVGERRCWSCRRGVGIGPKRSRADPPLVNKRGGGLKIAVRQGARAICGDRSQRPMLAQGASQT